MAHVMDEEIMYAMTYIWNDEEILLYHKMLRLMVEDNPIFVKAIADYWGNFSGYTLKDAWVYTNIKHLLNNGYLLFLQIPTIRSPHRDKQVKENNEIIKALPHPISGEFFGGVGENDGYIEWREEILMNVMRLNEKDELLGAKVKVQPKSIPLEVGYTTAGVTWWHLFRARCLARMPYGQNRIHIWINRFPYKPLSDLLGDTKSEKVGKTLNGNDTVKLPEYDYATDWMPFNELERFYTSE